ncbi:alpha/beta-hydrolase [Tothia fuscella]|uniref:Alpha/beta-hydrolase n=1 Tax=Tothia fuscella TaxID=1048955 RepID=A0A9P4NVY9_9PEZI|nr:alpha/beta-hydrolase [Tothia fuscella]
MFLQLALVSLVGAVPSLAWSIGQQVNSTSGPITGHAADWKPDVSEYLGIPFADPPIGNLRFAAPKPFKSEKAINATTFGLGCPENVGGLAATMKNVGEDCLTLNIWTKPQTGEKSKAVMIWIYGGGFGSGKSSTPTYNGARLADEHDVVVLSVNYRVNIYGFPRAPFAADFNPGLLDQRAGVEWARDNIAAFGGDPKRMIMFGQSAGGGSVDMYSFAYSDDPIVHGLIAESGTASNPSGPPQNYSASWWESSRSLGCGGIEAGEATLACVRSKTWQLVTDIVPRRGVTANLGAGNFGPTIDDKVVFSDYNKRRAYGAFAHIPMLVGNTNYEKGFYENLAKQRGETLPAGYRPPELDGCGPHASSLSYRKAGVASWRYLYSGTFANNTAPGAGHGDEIALVFGTIDHPSKRKSTSEEGKLSLYLRTAWTTFAKDPVNGLTKLGWPVYDEKSTDPTLVRLGGKESSAVAYELRSKYDKGCSS